MKPPRPVEVKPGRLMTGLSADTAGIQNYSVKRDFRRVLERDIRAEGYEWFRPNSTYDKIIQSIPAPAGGAISVIAEAQLGNGRIAIVAGNLTTLWRYVGLEDPNYFDTEGGSDYFDTEGGSDYFQDGQQGWMIIGTGFSLAGNRWEAVPVGNYLVLNNGVDLPLTYNLQESAALPIYELREQGVACVGTIAAQDGILCCMDISQISDSALLQIMSPIAASANASQNSSGTISPGASTLFPGVSTSTLVGLTLFWDNGTTTTISSVDLSGNMHTLASQPVKDAAGNSPYTASWTPTFAAPIISSQPVSIENAAAYRLFNDATNIQRYGYRFFPSMPSNPRRFGSQIPISIKAGSRIATLLFPVRSIPELVASGAETSFVFTGIALNGGNLTSDIIATSPNVTLTLLLDETAMTEQDFGTTDDFGNPLTNSIGFVEAADASASFAGVFEDLVDDGSRIVKALTLQGQLVIYRESPVIFLASYTGDLTTPFQFQRIPVQAEAAAIRFRNTLIAGGGGFYGSFHLYAGKNAFFKFDMFTQTPVEIPILQACSNIFFENASDTENAFAVENPLTREIFFVFNNSDDESVDTAICYDYAYQTARTTSALITAAGKVRHPVTRDYWFVMGFGDGSLKRYGLFAGPLQSSLSITASLSLGNVTASAPFFNPSHVGMTIMFADGTNAAIAEYVSPTMVTVYGDVTATVTGLAFIINPAIWHRDGQDYDSLIQSGQDAFGAPTNEKTLNEYVLSLSSKSPNTPLGVSFLGGPNADAKILQSASIPSPSFQNLVKPTVMEYYLGFTVAVSGMNNPVEITGHSISVIQVNSHSFGRRPIIALKNCSGRQVVKKGIPSPVLTAAAVSTSQINLSWNSFGPSATYNLYRSVLPIFTPAPSNLVKAGISGTTYSDTGLSSGVTYYYFLAVNV